jgi:capsular exopolysaccharide synthesis family protein
MPGEGKTLTAVNCATVLAQQGAKVLLVDSDLRQPSLHLAFKIPQGPGLSSVLAGACPAKEATSLTDIMPNLSLLASGPADGYPAEKLASHTMFDLLDHWRSRYDHIVLDTPPISMFTDAVVLGAQADAVLLVARAGSTTKYSLRHARDLLLRANANIAGVVLNGMDRKYERSYYGRYGYGRGRNEAGFVDN